MFETGARPHPPQEVYRAYLAQSDVFIGLYWQRYGWVGPGMQISGLEDELVLARALPRLLYVKAPAPDREPPLAEMLARVRAEGSVSYRRFSTPTELGRLVRDDLATLLSERFAASPAIPATAPSRGLRTLPVDTTSLVGREQAVGQVAELLGPTQARLMTLTGPGGVGKTRLAVAVGERLRDRFDAGVVFVALDRATRSDVGGRGSVRPAAGGSAFSIGFVPCHRHRTARLQAPLRMPCICRIEEPASGLHTCGQQRPSHWCLSWARCSTYRRPRQGRSSPKPVTWVPPVGIEPTTHGLGNRCSIP
jgi:hypothetical protein